jgi:purine nucleosidase
VNSTGAKRVIIDCDPGIGPGLDADDALAILFVLASPELELDGVTTIFGNVEVGRATENALRTLEAAGRQDVPVAQGMSVPLIGTLNKRSVDEYIKHDARLGMVDDERVQSGKSPMHAVDFIISKATESPGEISLLAVGPLTNVAHAILKQPSLKESIREITIMGGAFSREPVFGRGNITPVAEYNIWGDPFAANIVFESGIPVTAIGLDVTNPNAGTVLYEDQLLKLVETKSPLSEFLFELCRAYIDEPKFNWARKGCVLYDPVAAATMVDPSIVTIEQADVRVETTGEHARGQTIAYPNEEGRVAVCVDVNGDAFVDLFIGRIASLLESSWTEAARHA